MCTDKLTWNYYIFITNETAHGRDPKRLINCSDFLSKQNMLNLNFGLP